MNVVEALTYIPSPNGQEFLVYAFRPGVWQESGNVTEPMLIPLGAYSNINKAEDLVRHVRQNIGHQHIRVHELGQWSNIPMRKGMVPNKETADRDELAEYEEEKDNLQHIINEVLEDTPTLETLDDYAQLWYQTTRLRNLQNFLQSRLHEINNKVDSNKVKVMQMYQRNPNYESQWLDHLGKVMKERGEEAIYETIPSLANELHSEIFYRDVGFTPSNNTGYNHTTANATTVSPADHDTAEHNTIDHHTVDHDTVDHDTADYTTDHNTVDNNTVDHEINTGDDHTNDMPVDHNTDHTTSNEDEVEQMVVLTTAQMQTNNLPAITPVITEQNWPAIVKESSSGESSPESMNNQQTTLQVLGSIINQEDDEDDEELMTINGDETLRQRLELYGQNSNDEEDPSDIDALSQTLSQLLMRNQQSQPVDINQAHNSPNLNTVDITDITDNITSMDTTDTTDTIDNTDTTTVMDTMDTTTSTDTMDATTSTDTTTGIDNSNAGTITGMDNSNADTSAKDKIKNVYAVDTSNDYDNQVLQDDNDEPMFVPSNKVIADEVRQENNSDDIALGAMLDTLMQQDHSYEEDGISDYSSSELPLPKMGFNEILANPVVEQSEGDDKITQ